MPDLTVVLDVPPGVARGRIGAGRDRIEDRGEDYQGRVRQGYRDAVPGYPGPLAVVDGSADVEAVAIRVRSEVERALAFPPRS